MNDTWLLTLIIFLPAAWALVLTVAPGISDSVSKMTTLLVTGLECLLCFVLLGWFLIADMKDRPLIERAKATRTSVVGAEFQSTDLGDLVVRMPWIESGNFHIEYYLGVDGINLSMVILTGVIGLLSMFASLSIAKHVRGYCILYLVLLTGIQGVFLSLDFFLFYVFFEVMLLPMYFLIGIWGGPRREYSALKFFLFTLIGSVMVLIAMLGCYFNAPTPTFDIMELHEIGKQVGMTAPFSREFQQVIFALLFIGFAIKLPIVPFHTWLPDAHVEAPTPISMILAGVLLKLGGYGMVRVAYPVCPQAAIDFAWYVSLLGVFCIIYGAFVAMAQTDFKKLVAYSSVSHMGYVVLGLGIVGVVGGADEPWKYYSWGVTGAMFQMIAHGISSAGMFFLVGVIYDRVHHRDLNRFGGLLNIMPRYASVSIVIFFAAMGLPGLCGFFGEFATVYAGFVYSRPLGVIAALGVVLTAGYILWTMQRVFMGTSTQDYEGTPEIRWWPEMAVAVPLVVLAILLGVYPACVLDWMGPDVDFFAQQLTDVAGQLSPPVVANAGW